MTPIILRYAEDRTGESPNNRVVNETHQTVNRRVRAIAPYHGPFYSESLVVRNAVTNDVLIKDVDYHAVEYYESISRLTGKEVCAVILIVNEGITHQEFSIDYQVVGGEFSYGYDSIAKMMDKINNDDRPVHWGNLLNLPPEFIPSAHLHDIGDTFGWEYVVAELELIRKAILMGDSASHDEIYMYVDRRVEELRGESDQLEAKVDAHTVNYNNPHNVTKVQVGLGRVENYRLSTKSEAEAGSLNNVYMTALRVKEAITFQAVTPLTNLLTAHTSRTDNPHSVTKAQIGLGNVENYGVASKAQAEAGSASNLYMTPLRVKEAITAQAGTRLDAHMADASNPHNVTKAQVGLGSVENYSIATQTEAQTGTSNVKYMTPLRTSQVITTLAIVPLNTHINNKSNPHAVTKAQVGLGSVEDYGIATQAEAQTGTSNAKYMTPLRTSQAITTLAVTPLTNNLNSHTGNKNNPHSVTAAQTGAYTQAQTNDLLNTKLSLAGGSMTGVIHLAPIPINMASNDWGNGGLNIQVPNGVTGDNNVAGINFSNSTRYAMKMGMRHDGVFGIGGGSSVAWRWYNDASGNTYQTGDCYIYSDPRLKENQEKIEGSLEKLGKLTGYTFNWKDLGPKINQSGQFDYGLMANEVEAVFPEMVIDGIEMDDVQYKTVAYTKLIPVLLEAVKELSNKVNDLEARLDNGNSSSSS